MTNKATPRVRLLLLSAFGCFVGLKFHRETRRRARRSARKFCNAKLRKVCFAARIGSVLGFAGNRMASFTQKMACIGHRSLWRCSRVSPCQILYSPYRQQWIREKAWRLCVSSRMKGRLAGKIRSGRNVSHCKTGKNRTIDVDRVARPMGASATVRAESVRQQEQCACLWLRSCESIASGVGSR
jgi:hypothetical protein